MQILLGIFSGVPTLELVCELHVATEFPEEKYTRNKFSAGETGCFFKILVTLEKLV